MVNSTERKERREKVRVFLSDLTALSKKHGMYVNLKDVCCCGELEVIPFGGDTCGAQDLEWDFDLTEYTGFIYG
ncbi:hypothetical protein OG897_08610 [Streptomyces sp. NBC_00237]|uniref:hypothetical protein n=1 Tax=Streptomyces sp. NBC_00237 TaxID=2975687 RepID=UPI002258B0F7|nr:hypothetical protein [Streptomyces sp. NBC_00237]MCX5201511.1 hypothetical protein [Streptomyces sp. NBC_00237]